MKTEEEIREMASALSKKLKEYSDDSHKSPTYNPVLRNDTRAMIKALVWVCPEILTDPAKAPETLVPKKTVEEFFKGLC